MYSIHDGKIALGSPALQVDSLPNELSGKPTYICIYMYTHTHTHRHTGLPRCGSAGEESACNAGNPGLIPGSGRSPGEGRGYPLQYSWASLEAQLVKNLPAMQETWLKSLGWEDPLEKGKAIHSRILTWRIPWTVWSVGPQRVGHDWTTFTWFTVLC